METVEIILLVIGVIVFLISFLIPEKSNEMSESEKEATKEEVKGMIDKELENVKGHVDEVVQEAVNYAMEKTERSLERVSNEKIMAVNEYSDTVLKEIHKNHEEVMFLYDMLNDKQENLKNTMLEAVKASKELEESQKEAQAFIKEMTQGAPLTDRKNKNSDKDTKNIKNDIKKEVSKETNREVKKEIKLDSAAIFSQTPPAQNMEIKFTEQDMDGEAGNNRNEEILNLYRQGKSNVAIAKKLGLGVGEVKLVIDLYKNT